mmetsp:Transcript_52347/g.131500  ORF Transcript_52347/g.131500 Transcript_52347/m.131500 type:complete len:250 (+) Transcript_52347:828-1577(+)
MYIFSLGGFIKVVREDDPLASHHFSWGEELPQRGVCGLQLIVAVALHQALCDAGKQNSVIEHGQVENLTGEVDGKAIQQTCEVEGGAQKEGQLKGGELALVFGKDKGRGPDKVVGFLRLLGNLGKHLCRAWATADHSNALAPQIHVVIPLCCVELHALERADAGEGGSFGDVQLACGTHKHIAHKIILLVRVEVLDMDDPLVVFERARLHFRVQLNKRLDSVLLYTVVLILSDFRSWGVDACPMRINLE